MTGNEYQALANRTSIDEPDFQITPKQVMLSWSALGIAGEAGEIADLIKKGIFHQQGIDLSKLEKEIGDELWYLADMCKHLGITMEHVMDTNIQKLLARFPEGYRPDRTTFREGDAA